MIDGIPNRPLYFYLMDIIGWNIYRIAITRRGRLNLALRGRICWSIQLFESSMIEQHKHHIIYNN